jgi:hypothetical protein
MNNFQVITSFDKETRDELYDRLRASDDPQEAQVVKFSGVEPDPERPGKYRSAWSVAYPINGDNLRSNCGTYKLFSTKK